MELDDKTRIGVDFWGNMTILQDKDKGKENAHEHIFTGGDSPAKVILSPSMIQALREFLNTNPLPITDSSSRCPT